MKRKTVIVTGGSGYLGTEVCNQLLLKNYNIVTVDIKKPVLKSAKIKFYKRDLRENKNLSRLFKNAAFCVHLAALVGGVKFANENQSKILIENTLIDANVIKNCAKAKLTKFVYISTSIVYEQCKKIPYKEEYALQIPPPTLSYGVAKLYGEKLTSVSKTPYTICRVFNLYGMNASGKSDPHGHVIPDLIKKVKNSTNSIEVYGNGKQSRAFTHVKDAASGIIAAMESKNSFSEVFNIATNEEHSVQDILTILEKHFGKKLKRKYTKNLLNDIQRSFGDVGKARRLLGWEPRITLTTGMLDYLDKKATLVK